MAQFAADYDRRSATGVPEVKMPIKLFFEQYHEQIKLPKGGWVAAFQEVNRETGIAFGPLLTWVEAVKLAKSRTGSNGLKMVAARK